MLSAATAESCSGEGVQCATVQTESIHNCKKDLRSSNLSYLYGLNVCSAAQPDLADAGQNVLTRARDLFKLRREIGELSPP